MQKILCNSVVKILKKKKEKRKVILCNLKEVNKYKKQVRISLFGQRRLFYWVSLCEKSLVGLGKRVNDF